MDFGEILTRAWQIIWKHKILWLFGVLASCGRQGTNSSSRFSDSSGGGASSDFGNGAVPEGMQDFFLRVEQFLEGIPEETWIFVFIGLLCVGLIIAAIAFVLSVVGRGALIKGTVQAEGGVESLAFGQLIQDIRPYLGRLFLLNLMIAIFYVGIGFIFFFAIVLTALLTFGLGLLCWIPIICLFVPVGIALNVLIGQANIAIVVDDLPVFEALQRGWLIVRHNFSVYFVMTLILLIGGGVVFFLVNLPLYFVVVPFFASLAFGSEVAIFGGLAFAAICIALYLPVLLVVSGILQAYIESAWTLTYLRLNGAAAPA